jgi:hypothetical protein
MLCSDVTKPPQFEEMVNIAERIGDALGTFYRVDLFIAEDGGIVLGELTPNPFNAKMHCFAKDTGNPHDPADPCYMGRLWQEMEAKYVRAKGRASGGASSGGAREWRSARAEERASEPSSKKC